MYEVRVQGRFSAVHQLRLSDGVVEPLHGHDWNVEALFRGENLDAAGMLVDFEHASAVLGEVVGELNYTNLNTLPPFAQANPSAELVARLIFEQVLRRLGQHTPLAAVYLEEAPGCIAGFLAEAS